MTEEQFEQIHDYTKWKVVELLIDKHNSGVTLKNFKEIENLTDEILFILGLVGEKFYAQGKR